LITGASKGLGLACAHGFASEGAIVHLAARNDSALKSAAEAIRKQYKTEVFIHAVDLSKTENVVALGKTCADVDILVNNAGITRDNISMRMKDEEWEKVLQVNLTGTFRLTRAVMRGMMKRRFGRVVSITSIVGVTGNPGQANYAAAKAGLIGMSKSLAQELASRGITVNCVAPGFIATPMTDALTDEQKKGILARVPADRLGTSDEIAAGVVYLASE